MSKRILTVLFSALFFQGAAIAEDQAAKVVEQNALKYAPIPVFEGVSAAPVSGTPAQPGSLYVFSVKYAAGAKSLPHTHPDARVMTVISGDFYAGLGTELDETKLRALRPGDSVVIPANVVHYGWAKNGEALLFEVGIGPTGASLWPKAPAAEK